MDPIGGGIAKKTWVARIGKANRYLEDTWGYGYVMELKQFYLEKMSKDQLIATIYHELRHIDTDGDIKPHDIEDWDNMVATLGKNWVGTKADIINILDDEFPGWNELRRVGQQISIFDALDNVVSINKASKSVNGVMSL
ncbi:MULTISPECIES: putative metallopeptidase [unclassified Dehalobacter]|uniref:putative metallopeptidase n=1 Tax=unclassified Dehalobacter TaxID=2635733 RepID=UPI001FA9AFA0|nr:MULTISPECIES: putative metallopeptidase [unclassified Dehalobacter]